MEKIIKIEPSADFVKLFDKLIKIDGELLLYFDLDEKHLDKKTGKKIVDFLNMLNTQGVKFKIIRPIPKCLLGVDYNRLIKKFNIPKNCFECNDLFKVENKKTKSCAVLNKQGPKIDYMQDKNEIAEFFKILRLEKELAKKCKACLYQKRKTCDGLCLRR